MSDRGQIDAVLDVVVEDLEGESRFGIRNAALSVRIRETGRSALLFDEFERIAAEHMLEVGATQGVGVADVDVNNSPMRHVLGGRGWAEHPELAGSKTGRDARYTFWAVPLRLELPPATEAGLSVEAGST